MDEHLNAQNEKNTFKAVCIAACMHACINGSVAGKRVWMWRTCGWVFLPGWEWITAKAPPTVLLFWLPLLLLDGGAALILNLVPSLPCERCCCIITIFFSRRFILKCWLLPTVENVETSQLIFAFLAIAMQSPCKKNTQKSDFSDLALFTTFLSIESPKKRLLLFSI